MRTDRVGQKLALLAVTLFLLLAVGAALAQQQKTERFTLELTTQTMAMPFDLSGIPNAANIPGLAELSAPKRVVSGEAVYPNKAVEPIFVTVPGDLGLPQNKLVLSVPQPLTGSGETGEGGAGKQPAGGGKLTVELWWHPDTAEGPVTETVSGQASAQPAGPMMPAMPTLDWNAMAAALDKTATGSQDVLPKDVVGQGDYVLNTSGTAVLDGFLPPIEVTQPKSLNDVDPAEGIDVQWKPVEGARGYILQGVGMRSEGQQESTIIYWVSTLTEPPDRVRSGYEQETTIADDLTNGILLPAEATRCKVPPGIFGDVDTLMLTVIAVGNDFFNRADGITVRGKIRAEWMGTKMAQIEGMPGMGGAGEEETQEDVEEDEGEG